MQKTYLKMIRIKKMKESTIEKISKFMMNLMLIIAAFDFFAAIGNICTGNYLAAIAVSFCGVGLISLYIGNREMYKCRMRMKHMIENLEEIAENEQNSRTAER